MYREIINFITVDHDVFNAARKQIKSLVQSYILPTVLEKRLQKV